MSVLKKTSNILVNRDDKLGQLSIHQQEDRQHLMTDYPSIVLDATKNPNTACHDVIA